MLRKELRGLCVYQRHERSHARQLSWPASLRTAPNPPPQLSKSPRSSQLLVTAANAPVQMLGAPGILPVFEYLTSGQTLLLPALTPMRA
jgi:hypothetical protein